MEPGNVFAMRDIGILVMVIAFGGLAFIKPWLGVLGLFVVATLHPQGYGRGFMQSFPVYLILFVAVALAVSWDYLRRREWPKLRWDWRLPVFALLWICFGVSTSVAINPWLAWPKLLDTIKLLPPLLLVFLLIDTREKLHALLTTIAVCIAVVVLKGGYWAVITGFHDRVYGPPGSQYADNNAFAVATAMAIPLLSFWYKQARGSGLRWAVGVLIALAFAAAISSWSRGGLLSISAVALLLLWHSKRKWLALPIAVIGAAVAVVSLPQTWFSRMDTIGTYQSDASAVSRLETWKLGLEFVRDHPWFGGGFEGWIYATLPNGGSLAWHSSYVEMAAEHGLVGLALWGLLLFGSMVSLTWLLWVSRRNKDAWLADQCAMLRASLIAYAIGGAFLSIAYWELLYLLVVSAMLIQGFASDRNRQVEYHVAV